MEDDELAGVVALEKLLLDADLRSDTARLSALLADDFLEFGVSGRVWEKQSMVAALAADPQPQASARDFRPARLGDDVVLLTYRTTGPLEALRSSTWVRDAEGSWRLRFHQATQVAPLSASAGKV